MATTPKKSGVPASPLPRNYGRDVGDGDPCPDGHGRMYANPAKQTQYCPHRDHDGYPNSHPTRPGLPPSRKVWPLGHASFAEAVKVYSVDTAGEAAQLPDLDIDLGGLDL